MRVENAQRLAAAMEQITNTAEEIKIAALESAQEGLQKKAGEVESSKPQAFSAEAK